MQLRAGNQLFIGRSPTMDTAHHIGRQNVTGETLALLRRIDRFAHQEKNRASLRLAIELMDTAIHIGHGYLDVTMSDYVAQQVAKNRTDGFVINGVHQLAFSKALRSSADVLTDISAWQF